MLIRNIAIIVFINSYIEEKNILTKNFGNKKNIFYIAIFI